MVERRKNYLTRSQLNIREETKVKRQDSQRDIDD